MGLLGISRKHKNKTLTSFLFPYAPRRPLLLPPAGPTRCSLSLCSPLVTDIAATLPVSLLRVAGSRGSVGLVAQRQQ